MSDRFPLILNTSTNQIQEIASGDTLDLTGNNIKGVGIITATTISGTLSGIATLARGLTDIPDINVRNITGVGATFSKDLDVDGHTNLDNVSISGVVTATTFSGNATSADTVDVSGAANANTNFYITFAETNGAAKTIKIDDGLRYNASNNVLTASYFSGNGANLSGITNASISNSAAIAFSKLATGALPAGITVSGSNITAGAIHDSDVNASANIAGTKISPNFGSQNIVSTGYVSVKDLYLTDDNPTVYFTDSNNTDYIIEVNGGIWKVRDTSNSADRLVINSDGHVDIAGNLDCAAGIDVTGNATVSGNLSVGGVLTYEDVTNVDSVGLVTARDGVFIPDNKELKIGNDAASPDLKIYHNSSNNNSYITESGSADLLIQGTQIKLQDASGTDYIRAFTGGAVYLHNAGNPKFETTNTGAVVTGIMTATTLSSGNLRITDDGATGPLVSILADDSNPYALMIGNSSYSNTAPFGLNFFNNNSGEGYFRHIGNGSYKDYHFSLHDTSNNKLCIKFEGDDQSVELYGRGTKDLETTGTGVVVSGVCTATTFDGNLTGNVTGTASGNATISVTETIE